MAAAKMSTKTAWLITAGPPTDDDPGLSRRCPSHKYAHFYTGYQTWETGMATKAPWCAVTATVEVIGGRWKPTILFHLKDQPRRFNELRRLVPGITQRHAHPAAARLEQDGVVARTVHNSVPPHVEYSNI